jgi:hypothetical protein
MSWWNRIKERWRLVLGGFLLLIGIFVVVMRLIGPMIGEEFCTLADCLGSLGIVVKGLSAGTNYDLAVKYVNGYEYTLSCEMGKGEQEYDFLGNNCLAEGAIFTTWSLDRDEIPPKEITVTVTVDGKKVTKVFHPVYEKNYINGKDCEPVCYSSTITMDVSR